MSQPDSLVATNEALSNEIADFGALAIEAVHQLSREVRELREENEDLNRELALARIALDRKVGEG